MPLEPTDVYQNDNGLYEPADIKTGYWPYDAYISIGAGILLALAAFYAAFIG